MRLLLLLVPLIWTAPAMAGRVGHFDYFLLALSWTPSWCATEGDARGAETCERGAGHGWTLHGLWPQYERGWPEWCEPEARDPSRHETAAMADLMGSAGLAWHQWRKHGRCSGLDPRDYFALAREASATVALPEPAAAVEAGMLADMVTDLNPGMPQDGLIVTCREGFVMEVRVCLDRDLGFRSCAEDVLERSCRPERMLAAPPRR